MRNDILTLWEDGIDTPPSYLDDLNGMETIGKMKVAMEITGENGLKFLDLKMKIAEGKIRVDAYVKPSNSFSCTSPNTCYSKKHL